MKRFRLSVMMFLEYAIWGAWAQLLWPHLTQTLGFSQTEAGWIFMLLWMAALLVPFTAGQIADRYLDAQKLLGTCQLVGSSLLFLLGFFRGESTAYFILWITVMGLYALFYAPTLALTNTIALSHLKNDLEFGRVRVWGSIGWAVSGGTLTLIRFLQGPAFQHSSDCLFFAAFLSLLMGVYAFFLPSTPPQNKHEDPLAFRKAFSLLKDSALLIFIVAMGIISALVQFYFGLAGVFLEKAVKISSTWVPLALALAQIAEIFAMSILLPFCIRRFGLRKTMFLGGLTWPIQYFLFAIVPFSPLHWIQPVVICALAFHGLGFPLFFIGSQIFIDRVASKDIQNSAQSLLEWISLGIGGILGTFWTAQMMELFTKKRGSEIQTDWQGVFGIPAVIASVTLILFYTSGRKFDKISK